MENPFSNLQKSIFLQDAEIEGLQTALREIPKLSDIQGD
jgi:hypothetical protein